MINELIALIDELDTGLKEDSICNIINAHEEATKAVNDRTQYLENNGYEFQSLLPDGRIMNISFDKNRTNGRKMAALNLDSERGSRLDANAHHVIKHLHRIKNRVNVLGNCGADGIYNSITSSDNYKFLVNLRNTLAASRLLEPKKGELIKVLERFFVHVERWKPEKDVKKRNNTDNHQRVIQHEELAPFFNSTFKGMGNGSINYFDFMTKELQTNRPVKEFAQIALMAYEGDKMNKARKPTTFAKWLNKFCMCISVKHVGYKPNKLKPIDEKLQQLFNYLS